MIAAGYTGTLNDGLHVGPGCRAGFIMLEPLHLRLDLSVRIALPIRLSL